MKKICTLFILFFLTAIAVYGQATPHTFAFEGKQREYLLYVPNIYTQANEDVPLVVVLHGLGDNMNNMSQVGFHQIADTANFIVVTPQALPDTNPLVAILGPAWNSGAAMFGITPNATLNDVGFLMALADSIAANYNIDQNRIYFTGFSMGGYMSNRMACERSERVAAIASVAGTIGASITCNPSNPVATLHCHGTADAVVNYSNNLSGMDAEALVEFWRGHNNCNPVAIHTDMPNTNTTNGYTVEHFLYPNGEAGTATEFFKVNGADHTWLGPNNDIYYTEEIWRFLSSHSKNSVNAIQPILNTTYSAWAAYPNPTKDKLHLDFLTNAQANGNIILTDMAGRIWHSAEINGKNLELDMTALPTGIYLLQWQNKNGIQTKRILVK